MAMNRGEWSEFYAILSLLENPNMNIVNENFEDIPSDRGYYTWWFTKDKTELLLSKINRELNAVDRIDFS